MYGAHKVQRQLQREGITVARCTTERLRRQLGLRGAKLSVPLTEPSRHNGPSRPPGSWRSTGTAGGSIGDQDSAGCPPGE